MYDAPMQQQSSGILDFGWVKSVNGILKASEIGISVIAVITSSVWESKVCCTGGGWVQFVSTTALVCTAILYMLYFVSVAEKLRSSIGIFSLVELGYNGGVLLCYFISAIVAAVYGFLHPSIAASAFFCFAALVPYGIDTFFTFQTWRSTSPPPPSLPPQQTPGTIDSVERGPQY